MRALFPRFGVLLVIGLAVVGLCAVAGDALADVRSPFGVGIAETAPAASSGFFGWIAQQQRAMYRGLTGAVRAIHEDGWAVIGLASLSFLYGVFHAAGPGHGKAVIASYLLANNETLKRGIVLSFASAFVQATVAVTIVLVAALLFNATARSMTQAAYVVEVGSYGLVLALGLYLVWTKALRSGAVFTREPPARALGAQVVGAGPHGVVARESRPHADAPGAPAKASHGDDGRHDHDHGHDRHEHGAKGHVHHAGCFGDHDHSHAHDHDHDHHHDHGHRHGHGHQSATAASPMPGLEAARRNAILTPLPVLTPAPHHGHAHVHAHGHDHAHDEACGCGHSHAPDPRALQGTFDLRRGIAVVLAAGLRPCSGAIIVLVFALSQGLLWAGVASAYAMAMGTGITVAVLAAIAVSGSALAVRLAGTGSPWAGRIHRAVEIGGSLAVLALGIILVGGALSGDGSL